ncbi:hypothetical protein HQQ80_12710 [Microbacteriaceae bacterium VKM Ac-2855]|nr:hypothetical protein [Microbacteriaceae bacterium VKM Ac-2855]
MPVRLHAPTPAYTGVGELDAVPALLRAGGPVLLGLEIEAGTTLLAHGGGPGGWAALVRGVGSRGRRRAAETTGAGALARQLGDTAREVTVLLGAESSVARATSRASARAAAAEWRDLDLAVAIAGEHAVRMLALARDLELPAVLVEEQPAVVPVGDDPVDDHGLLAEEQALDAAVPPFAVRMWARAATARAGIALPELLAATEHLVARCRIDTIADLGWGAEPAAVVVATEALAAAGLTFSVAGSAVAGSAVLGSAVEGSAVLGPSVLVEQERVTEALTLLAAEHPGCALLPDGGIVLDGSAVPRRGRRHGHPLAAFDRLDCTELGLATIGVHPDRALSALAHARVEAGDGALSADDLVATHPLAAACGALEFGLETPAVSVLPVSVTASARRYRIEGDAIRPPLRLAGLTDAEIERILGTRPFRSLDDFAARAAPARARMLRLAAEGALDPLLPGVERAAVLARVRALGSEPAPGDDAAPALFAGLDIPLPPPPPPPHAIESYRPMLDELEVLSAGSLVDARPGAEVLVAGLRIAGDRAPRGSTGLSVRLEDGSGVADCAFPADAQRAVGALLSSTRLMLVQGRTREGDDDHVRIEAENAWDLKRMWADWSAQRRRSA